MSKLLLPLLGLLGRQCRSQPASSPNQRGSGNTSSYLLRVAPTVLALQHVWPYLCGGKNTVLWLKKALSRQSWWARDDDGFFNTSMHFCTEKKENQRRDVFISSGPFDDQLRKKKQCKFLMGLSSCHANFVDPSPVLRGSFFFFFFQ